MCGLTGTEQIGADFIGNLLPSSRITPKRAIVPRAESPREEELASSSKHSLTGGAEEELASSGEEKGNVRQHQEARKNAIDLEQANLEKTRLYAVARRSNSVESCDDRVVSCSG